MVAIKERGETPFGEVGDGVILFFSNTDLKQLQADPRLGRNFLAQLSATVLSEMVDIQLLEDIARKGAKKADRSTPAELGDDAFDKIILVDLIEMVVDGLYQSVHGSNFQEYLDKSKKAIQEAADAGDIPPDQTQTMTSSPMSESGL